MSRPSRSSPCATTSSPTSWPTSPTMPSRSRPPTSRLRWPHRWPTCRPARRSARWSTACSRWPTRTRPTSRRSCAATSRSSGVWWPVDAGGRELAAALVPLHHSSLGPLAGGLTLGEIGLRRPALRARLRDPAGRRRHRAGRRVSLTDVGALLTGTSPTDDPLRPYAARLRRPGSAASRCAATCPAPSTSCSGCPGRRSALPRRRLQDQLARPGRPAAHRGGLLPRRGWWRRCCTPTTRCRRCSTSWSCTATCAGASPATTRRATSAACSTSTSAACAAPRPPRTTATRPGSSRGSRRPRSSTALSDLLDGALMTC